MSAARLARITIYPFKSLDGVDVPSAALTPRGGLAGDRQFALVDDEGHWINAKRTADLNGLDFHWDPQRRLVRIGPRGSTAPEAFLVDRDLMRLEESLGRWLGRNVRVVEEPDGGFPDDREAPGPTVWSSGTVAEVAGWFDLPQGAVRRRFRANLEVDAGPAFWEDRLVGEPGWGVRFAVGPIELVGTNPCQRCVVPSRDPDTGAAWPRFASTFAARRWATRPAWAPAARFDHDYRLTTNTRLLAAPAGARIALGDEVRILGPMQLAAAAPP